MVARLIRTLLANALLSASLLLREAGSAILPHDAPYPPPKPGNRPPSDDRDAPPVVVHVPPEAQAMVATGKPREEEPEPEPLAGSIAARRKAAGL